jgi:hypothetical protein
MFNGGVVLQERYLCVSEGFRFLVFLSIRDKDTNGRFHAVIGPSQEGAESLRWVDLRRSFCRYRALFFVS